MNIQYEKAQERMKRYDGKYAALILKKYQSE